MYVETLDGRQSSALAEFVAISLREENQLTGPDLQALYLLQRADDSSHVSTFENGLSHVDPRAVQLSLDGLARLKPDAVFDKLPQLTQHQAYKSSYGFRRAVIETVAAYGAESSIEFLIDQLPSPRWPIGISDRSPSTTSDRPSLHELGRRLEEMVVERWS